MKQWILKQLVKWMTPRLRFIYHNPELWRYVESKGYHVTPVHFYQPIPNTQALDETYRPESAMIGIDWNEDAQLRILRETLPLYASEYREFFERFQADGLFAGRRLEFIGHDPAVYHGLIRHFQPRRIVEVGGGFSTVVAANAAALNGDTDVYAIEPYANDYLDSLTGQIRLIKQVVQTVDSAFFDELQENDMLFIDSSHIVKTGSDVCYLVLEVLPRLRKGVIVHFHDIFLPFEYPRIWLEERRLFWNEQYLVQAFLIHNRRARILFANSFMANRQRALMERNLPASEGTGGGSLWLQV